MPVDEPPVSKEPERCGSARSLADCISTNEEEEWSALEGVTRVNSLLNLPRKLSGDKKSTSWKKRRWANIMKKKTICSDESQAGCSQWRITADTGIFQPSACKFFGRFLGPCPRLFQAGWQVCTFKKIVFSSSLWYLSGGIPCLGFFTCMCIWKFLFCEKLFCKSCKTSSLMSGCSVVAVLEQ